MAQCLETEVLGRSDLDLAAWAARGRARNRLDHFDAGCWRRHRAATYGRLSDQDSSGRWR